MKIRVERRWYFPTATVGYMFIDGDLQCYTLEDTVRDRGQKVDGQTAIWAGTYKVVLDMSTRFQRKMLHILDVPDFSGIRIHKGNTDKDTEGCILVGALRKDNTIVNSGQAYDIIFPKVVAALNEGEEVTIEIVDNEEARRNGQAGNGQG